MPCAGFASVVEYRCVLIGASMKVDPLLILILGASPVLIMGFWASWQKWREDHQERSTSKGDERCDATRPSGWDQAQVDAWYRLSPRKSRTRRMSIEATNEDCLSVNVAMAELGMIRSDYFMWLHYTLLERQKRHRRRRDEDRSGE